MAVVRCVASGNLGIFGVTRMGSIHLLRIVESTDEPGACIALIHPLALSLILRNTMLSSSTARFSRLVFLPTAGRCRSGILRYHGFRSMHFHATNNGNRYSSIVMSPASILGLASFVAIAATKHQEETLLQKPSIPSSGDVISSGTPVKEVATGILFPPLCNGYYLAGTGVRVKWGLIKVYAVGTYVDPLAMSAVKSDEKAIEAALLDPAYPRTIRIVMNRALSIDKYTAAIVEALKPRMNGEDLDKLDEFKALNPPVNLIQGTRLYL